MRIAVTGANGRIGRALLPVLVGQGHAVVAIDTAGVAQAGVENRALSVTDYEGVLAAVQGCQAVVHLAAIPGPIADQDHVVHNNNVTGSYNVLRAAAEAGARYVVQASSINAIGAAYSRQPIYDYFPLNELHASRTEDPYSLSKWICEQQADSIARRYETMTLASLRFHWVVDSRDFALEHHARLGATHHRHLWGYVPRPAVIDAIVLGLQADYLGHEVFYIVASRTAMETPTLDLVGEHYPDVPIRGDLSGTAALYDCSKTVRLLGWQQP